MNVLCEKVDLRENYLFSWQMTDSKLAGQKSDDSKCRLFSVGITQIYRPHPSQPDNKNAAFF
jgi:hypothetical protein